MSVLASSKDSEVNSDNAAAYYQCLLMHAHVILKMGYGRLDTSELHSADEEDITGLLAEAMNEALASPESPAWRCFYSVHEEPRVKSKKLRGKRRLRLDIQVEYTGGKRPRFSFEAKRLRASDVNSIGKYFGEEGLGCFVLGLYANEDDEAGMLAYIQSDDHTHWANAIHAGLKRRVKKCEWKTENGWVSIEVAEGLATTFKTIHTRTVMKKEIGIYHTLLEFLPAAVQPDDGSAAPGVAASDSSNK